MAEQHTPGPWRANACLVEVANGMALEIAHVRSPRTGVAAETLDESKANARLIAAAPELLTELQALVNAVDEYIEAAMRDGEPIYLSIPDSTRAAIAKARGIS